MKFALTNLVTSLAVAFWGEKTEIRVISGPKFVYFILETLLLMALQPINYSSSGPCSKVPWMIFMLLGQVTVAMLLQIQRHT